MMDISGQKEWECEFTSPVSDPFPGPVMYMCIALSTIDFIYVCVFTKFYKFFKKVFKLLECKYNELQCGIRISSIDVSHTKATSITLVYVDNKIEAKKSVQECCLSLMMGFRAIPANHRCLCTFPRTQCSNSHRHVQVNNVHLRNQFLVNSVQSLHL